MVLTAKDICEKCIGEDNHGFFLCKICSENYKLNHHWNDVMGIIDKRTEREGVKESSFHFFAWEICVGIAR